MDTNADNAFDQVRFEKLLEKFRGAHLDSFNSQREEVLSKRRTFRAGFEHRIRERWDEALDEYEVIVEAALMMWWQFNKRWFRAARAARDYKTISLIDLDARCLRVAQEVFALLCGGFAIGAHARTRTMHELAVVAFFIRDNPPDVAQRYQEHSVVERYRRAVEYNRTLPVTHFDLGYEPIEEETIKALAKRRDELKERYGADFLNVPYGWAVAALGKRKPTFRDLEEAVSMSHVRPFYAWSSQDIHPGSHGNELSYLERGSNSHTLNAGPSNVGLADPAQGALISLHQATTALCTPLAQRESPEESCPVVAVHAYRIAEVAALGELVEKAQYAFLAAHHKLEQEDRRIWQQPQQELSNWEMEHGLQPDHELLEDARSIGEGMWRMAQLAQDAAESLGSRIGDEDLDGQAEVVEVREALERLQALSLEVSEELDAYQDRHRR